MNTRFANLILILLVTLAAGIASAQVPPDRDALLAGEVTWQSAAAETNGYPEPKKILDAAKDLKLTPAQLTSVDGVAKELKSRSTDLGKRIIAVEEELSDAFKSDLVSEKTIQETTDQIAKMRGKLRAAHLTACLKTKAILTEAQLRTFAAMKSPAKTGKGH